MSISRKAVMDEVAQTTNYSGDRKVGDEGAYERIATVDEDEAELGRFWNECRGEVAQAFVRLLSGEGMDEEDNDRYELRLNVSVSFDMALLPGMELGMFSYFVHSITAKWFVFTNKEEAGAWADRSIALLEEVKEKAFFKKKPIRPTFS